MTRTSFKLAPAALCLLLLSATASPAAAKDTWRKVTSKNFTLVGNASEKEIRQVAARLEQFREAFSRVFSRVQFDTFVPTTVVVFKDFDAYKPYNPLGGAGYFQAGEDVNYITLTAAERRLGDDDPFSTIYHEYLHLLVNNNMVGVPVWVNEGMAEYYSTFEVMKDGRQVRIGKPISHHVLYLREQKFLPLRTLLNVDHDSPHYNERSKRGVFYAQSWALVHQLLYGQDGRRREQFGRYLQLLGAGRPSEAAFREAFGDEFDAVEKEMKAYVGRNTYPTQIITLGERLSAEAETQAAEISEAEAEGYLGDLLLHIRLYDAAEKHIRKALMLDPSLAMAQASLGMLRVRQGRLDDARQALEKAVAGNSRNYLAHYYYAFALTRERVGGGPAAGGGYSPEFAKLVGTHLKKAMELAPNYAEPYHLHAFLSLATGHLDEAEAFVRKATALAPGKREEFALTLGQIHLRRNDFKAARALLEPIAQKGSEAHLRRNAHELLEVVQRFEEFEARRKEFEARREGGPPVLSRRDESAGTETGAGAPGEAAVSEEIGGQPPLSSIRPRAEGEEQARGLLVQIECTAKGVVLHVRAGERLLKFLTTKFDRVDFVSYTQEMGKGGEISCGQRNPPNHVLVTYRPEAAAPAPAAGQPRAAARRAADKNARPDGEVLAVDFIPADWK